MTQFKSIWAKVFFCSDICEENKSRRDVVIFATISMVSCNDDCDKKSFFCDVYEKCILLWRTPAYECASNCRRGNSFGLQRRDQFQMKDEEDILFLPQANGNVAKILFNLTRRAMKFFFFWPSLNSESKMSDTLNCEARLGIVSCPN